MAKKLERILNKLYRTEINKEDLEGDIDIVIEHLSKLRDDHKISYPNATDIEIELDFICDDVIEIEASLVYLNDESDEELEKRQKVQDMVDANKEKRRIKNEQHAKKAQEAKIQRIEEEIEEKKETLKKLKHDHIL